MDLTLAELLLEKGYMVHGIKRRSSQFKMKKDIILLKAGHEILKQVD